MFKTPKGLSSAVTEAARRSSLETHQAVESFWHDRFLCRIFSEVPSRFILKGGQGMLARIPEARATRDIDLIADAEDLEKAIVQLDELAAIDLKDFMRFVRPGPAKPINLDGEYRPGVTLRYEVFVGDNKKGTLSIDLVVGEVLYGEPERIIPKHRLTVSGLEEHPYYVYPIEDAVADKVGAILQTYLNNKPSTRVKDLVDLVLIAQTHTLDSDILTAAINREIRLRKIPHQSSFSVPKDWFDKYEKTYIKLATEASLASNMLEIQKAETFVNALLGPVMENGVKDCSWSPSLAEWALKS